MRKLTTALVLTATLLFVPPPARAWNGPGHMTVARIAYASLADNTRARVDRLLRQHPDFARLRTMAGVPASHPDFGLRVFIQAATWPDIIRSDTRFNRDGDPPAPLLPGYPDMGKHTNWHFIDHPLSTDGTPTAPAPTPNALTELPRLISEIGNASVPRSFQAYDLVWVLHLTGDVHQPLHAATRFTTKNGPPEGDRGGNLFAITVPGSSTNNLHSFWDGLLGTNNNASVVKTQGTQIMNQFPAESPANTNPQEWADQSFQAARETAYSLGPNGAGDPTPRVRQSYTRAARLVARERAALAGRRLAAILNERLP